MPHLRDTIGAGLIAALGSEVCSTLFRCNTACRWFPYCEALHRFGLDGEAALKQEPAGKMLKSMMGNCASLMFAQTIALLTPGMDHNTVVATAMLNSRVPPYPVRTSAHKRVPPVLHLTLALLSPRRPSPSVNDCRCVDATHGC